VVADERELGAIPRALCGDGLDAAAGGLGEGVRRAVEVEGHDPLAASADIGLTIAHGRGAAAARAKERACGGEGRGVRPPGRH